MGNLFQENDCSMTNFAKDFDFNLSCIAFSTQRESSKDAVAMRIRGGWVKVYIIISFNSMQ